MNRIICCTKPPHSSGVWIIKQEAVVGHCLGSSFCCHRVIHKRGEKRDSHPAKLTQIRTETSKLPVNVSAAIMCPHRVKWVSTNCTISSFGILCCIAGVSATPLISQSINHSINQSIKFYLYSTKSHSLIYFLYPLVPQIIVNHVNMHLISYRLWLQYFHCCPVHLLNSCENTAITV